MKLLLKRKTNNTKIKEKIKIIYNNKDNNKDI
jgi:hypothetical protein